MSDDQNDEFKVVTPVTMNLLVEKLHELEKFSEKIRWKELQARTGTDSMEAAKMSCALKLARSQATPALYRKSENADALLCSLWMADVLTSAQLVAIEHSQSKFMGLSLDALRSIAKLSRSTPSFPELANTLIQQYGVIVICNQTFTGMKMDGLVTKLPNGQPVIGLSLRYPRFDNFWFTLMHELSHIALHYERLEAAIYDDLDDAPTTQIEVEANRLATDSFIPRRFFSKAAVLRSRHEEDLLRLASESEIHPIIAAGQMQFHFKNYKLFSKIVSSLNLHDWLKGTQ